MYSHRVFQTEYAGHPITFRFLNPETLRFFQGWLRLADADTADVAVTPELLEYARPLNPPGEKDSYIEYRCLIAQTSLALLKYDCCIFHCACFVWRGYAWLLTAPSGTGKTTQYLNWQKAHPGELTMLSGDMPVLERREDGSVWAHPTTWNGKENLGSRISAPVGGVVLLEQGPENVLTPLSVRDGLIPIFQQFLVRPDTEEQIRALGRLMDQMFRELPFWKLVNLGDPASTELIRDAFAQHAASLPAVSVPASAERAPAREKGTVT